jgi:hypothetical protein
LAAIDDLAMLLASGSAFSRLQGTAAARADLLERSAGMTSTNHYGGWAALLAALLLLIVLGCGRDVERQNASGRSGERSTGGAPGPNAKYNLVCGAYWSTVPSASKLKSLGRSLPLLRTIYGLWGALSQTREPSRRYE